jgi:cobalt-zinc-cadmium efflux system protein
MTSAATEHRGRLVIVLCLTLTLVAVEAGAAWITDSLALLADAGHGLIDAVGISIALFAIWLGRRSTHEARSYGLYRVEILAAAANALLLLALSAFIIVEAIRRLSSPPEIASVPMLVVAMLGLIGNALSMFLLHEGQRHSLNMRGAYLEVFGDLLGSVAVVVAAIVIFITQWTIADPIASLIIGVLIIPRTWRLLADAVDVLLESTPRGVDVDQVRQHIRALPEVVGVHDLHAWTITSGMNVVSAHVVIENQASQDRVLDALAECLSDDFDIEHSTFQLEAIDRRRVEEAAHR